MDASAAFPAWWYLRMLPGLVVIVALAGSVQLFDSAAAAAPGIEWVTVGAAGNPPDPVNGRGAVAGVFQVRKHDVTVEQ